MHASWMAAVLACGKASRMKSVDSVDDQDGPGSTLAVLDYWGAALSHLAAASLWELLSPRDGPVDISIRGYGGRTKRSGIRLHRSRSLLPAVVTLCSGIPVTTPARTISDLRRVVATKGRNGALSPRELRRAIRQAEVLGLPLGDEVESDRTRSELERDFLRLCRRYRLPAPEVNVPIGPHLVDFLWRDSAVIVETDGYRYHGGRRAFTQDRARDLTLRSMGFEVIRISEEQVNGESDRVADTLKRVLGSRSR
jgi:very-short-patch-repair endonuclease